MCGTFNINNWLKQRKFIANVKSPATRKKLTLFKASILAILFGVVLGAIVIFANGYNGITFFIEVFKKSTDTDKRFGDPTIYKTMLYFSAYLLLGLGLAIGFKIGIFNMGGSGQGVLGVGLAVVAISSYAQSHGLKFSDVPSSFAINVFLIFIVSGVAFSTFAGLLKVFFNIHEVVTTVMLNWTMWYFVKWLLEKTTLSGKPLLGYDQINQTPDMDPTWFNIGSNPYLLSLLIALSSIVIMWVIMTFTTFGYKFRMVGLQPEAARYAGIKNKMFLIATTSLQGLFIGLGVMFYYFQIDKMINYNKDEVPSVGFDAIAVSLVAFNNFFGLIPVAFLWAVFKNGSDLAVASPDFLGLSQNAAQLMFGTVIYGAAIFALFIKFAPFKFIKEQIYLYKDSALLYIIGDKKIAIKNIKDQKKLIIKSDIVIQLGQKVEKAKEELVIALADTKLKTNDYESYLVLKTKLKEEIKLIESDFKSKKSEVSKDELANVLSNYRKLKAIKKIEIKNNNNMKYKSIYTSKNNLGIAKDNLKFEKGTQMDVIKGSIKLIRNDISNLKKQRYEEYMNKTNLGVIRIYKSVVNSELYKVVNELTYVTIERDKKIQRWKKELKDKIKQIKLSAGKAINSKQAINSVSALDEIKKLNLSKNEKIKELKNRELEILNKTLEELTNDYLSSKASKESELKNSQLDSNLKLQNELDSINLRYSQAKKRISKNSKFNVYKESSKIKIEIKNKINEIQLNLSQSKLADYNLEILKLKREFKLNVMNLKFEVNSSSYASVFELEEYRDNKNVIFKECNKVAKLKVKELKDERKLKLKDISDKTEIRAIKEDYISKLMEVANKYGSNICAI